MKTALIGKIIPALIAAAGLVVLFNWVHDKQVEDEQLREPAPAPVTTVVTQPTPATSAATVASGTTTAPAPVVKSSVVPPAVDLPGAWPCFRGANFDNISTDATPLAHAWPASLTKYWTVNLGEGYAGAAVLHGRVYVLDYDQTAKADTLRCLSLASGQEYWNVAYPVEVKRNHGMSRTVPALTDKYVVTLGPKCHVMCTDATSGKVLWRHQLVAEFNTTVPEWYAGQCPLIDGDRVILAPGGPQALMIACDLATGKVLWQTPNPRNWQMTHSSIVPMTFAGQRMYLYCASDGVVGVSAKDGKELWETGDWKVSTATIPVPLPIGDGRIFITGGYNAGSIMLQVSGTGRQFAVKTLYRLPASTFSSAQQSPILYKGNIYGVIQDGSLVCLDLTGKQVWTSGGQHFGLGPYLIAGGMIYLLNDTGTLTLADASPAGYKPLAQAKILDGPDAWGPMALVGGRLIARDLTHMVCVEVGKH